MVNIAKIFVWTSIQSLGTYWLNSRRHQPYADYFQNYASEESNDI